MLERTGVLRTLAEPNLTALSGETAKFLAGGEFPVPVSQQNNTVTVDYKQFGVNVTFKPMVLSEGRISLAITAEVSEIANEGAVTSNSHLAEGPQGAARGDHARVAVRRHARHGGAAVG